MDLSIERKYSLFRKHIQYIHVHVHSLQEFAYAPTCMCLCYLLSCGLGCGLDKWKFSLCVGTCTYVSQYLHMLMYITYHVLYIVSVCGNTMCYLNYREAEVQVLPEPYFSLSDSRDTSCAIRFFSEPVPQLRNSWDNTWCYRKPRQYRFPPCKASNLIYVLYTY